MNEARRTETPIQHKALNTFKTLQCVAVSLIMQSVHARIIQKQCYVINPIQIYSPFKTNTKLRYVVDTFRGFSSKTSYNWKF